MNKRKVFHVEMKEPVDGKRHFYFGSNQVTLRPHLVCETHEGGDGKLLLSFIDSQIMQKVAVCNGLLFQT